MEPELALFGPEFDEQLDQWQLLHGTAPITQDIRGVNLDRKTGEAAVLLQVGRVTEIEQQILAFIDKVESGEACHVAESIAQIRLETKVELELMAKVIVLKALDEPRYCEACAILSSGLYSRLPALPLAAQQGRKAESFMHALLDVFQAEFEYLFFSPAEFSSKENRTSQKGKKDKLRTAVIFAGHLHCRGLLGKRVVSQIVQDLVDTGKQESARELLWWSGMLPGHSLGTVLEEAGESDGGSSARSLDCCR
mmetsp:Transcript_70818/g.196741  ORF Transcript_70818/g.196741 Transcript_70818/m.196741 type:complete len:252 (-) Transcript_70818:331-1086(-)